MDCNGTGSYDVFNFLHLRTHVWDRMEYLIHIHKAVATAEAETFDVAITDPIACDDFDTAETLEADKIYATPNFAGEYFYRVVSPARIITSSCIHSPSLKMNTHA